VTLAGRILENCPVVRARVQDEVLILGRTGPEELLVDTGFTGAIALPRRLLRRLRLEFIAIDSFTLATGEAVDLPAYAGVVGVGPIRFPFSDKRRLRAGLGVLAWPASACDADCKDP